MDYKEKKIARLEKYTQGRFFWAKEMEKIN